MKKILIGSTIGIILALVLPIIPNEVEEGRSEYRSVVDGIRVQMLMNQVWED